MCVRERETETHTYKEKMSSNSDHFSTKNSAARQIKSDRRRVFLENQRLVNLTLYTISFFFSTFIYFWDRERQSMNGGWAEREGDTEWETGSRLRRSEERRVGKDMM